MAAPRAPRNLLLGALAALLLGLVLLTSDSGRRGGGGRGWGAALVEEELAENATTAGNGTAQALTHAEQKYAENKSAFADRHPNQAERIHLQHEAERQNELREEYHKKREETLAALSETARARNTIVCILAIIVMVTVLFEKIAHAVMHHCSDFSKPVVEVLFKELTVLGFIALCVFMGVKTGVPQKISQYIFGTPSELVEMFDETHVLLFLIVVLFVGMVELILWRFSAYCREWETWEIIALDAHKQGKSLDALLAMPYGARPQRALPEEMRAYFVMRHAFLNPHVQASCREKRHFSGAL